MTLNAHSIQHAQRTWHAQHKARFFANGKCHGQFTKRTGP